MYETIKQFLSEGGRCLLIEDGKPIGIVLTMEEYKLLQSKPYQQNLELPKKSEPNFDFNTPAKEIKPDKKLNTYTNVEERIVNNPIGEAMVKEIFPDLSDEALAKLGASAELTDINLADDGDVTLEDLGLDELPY